MTYTDLATMSQTLSRLLDVDDIASASTFLSEVPSFELEGVLGRLDQRKAAVAFRLLPKDVALTTFQRLDASMQGDILTSLHDDEVTSVFSHLDPDDRADLLDELPANVSSKLLRGLTPEERDLTGIVLGYPAGSIGRRMSPEVLLLRETITCGEALDIIRDGADQAETIYSLPVINDQRVLTGIVDLRELMFAHPEAKLSEITHPTASVSVDVDEEVAARRCADLKLLVLPVVDHAQRLIGILTVDDALVILEEAENEDQARMSGSEPINRPYLNTPVTTLVRSRLVWLLVLGLGATLTVQVLEVFESTLEQMVVLSLFVPLLIGTGGNTGNQAATTVTRALALGDVEPRDILRVIGREVRVGAALGLLLGTLGFAISALFYGLTIGLVIGLTLLSICTLAATVGGAMPIIGKRLNVDPAVFANPFITTLVDASGLVLYFLIARAVLGL